ncbi:UDP-N-acetylmuramoyl-L-alanyl-D-glutamate--2,6-diaminopimelate ligase [Aurantivibrio plasticivorans]
MSANQQSYGVRLSDLLPDIWLPGEVGDVFVTGVQSDHRLLQKGDVFIAQVGASVDARQFIGAALRAGAAAIIKELSNEDDGISWHSNVPVIPVKKLDQIVSAIASRFYAEPSHSVRCIAVTGTNGKTTVAYLFSQLVAKLEQQCGLMGTLGNGIVSADSENNSSSSLTSTGLTTAGPVAVQATLGSFAAKGVARCVMEVSSHSLHQSRVAAVDFKTAILTNLSRDHLDYHGSMENYAEAKAKLFHFSSLEHAIVNIDDEFGCELTQRLAAGKVVTYSTSNEKAAVYCRDVSFSAEGVDAWVVTPWGEGKLSASLLGEFNLSNLLAVIAAASLEGFDLQDILTNIALVSPATGRMEVVSMSMRPLVVVDYAHTPDGLSKALGTLKPQCEKTLWCVFGCGGDRDRGKRAQMASIAEQLADCVVVTSDNPRTEPQEAIEKDIRLGFQQLDNVVFERDRAKAIKYAILHAADEDIILIAGKGHETYQQIGVEKLPFSDVGHARLALQQRMEISS